jgi:hypothetical protein
LSQCPTANEKNATAGELSHNNYCYSPFQADSFYRKP